MSASSRLVSATRHGPDADTRTALRISATDDVFEIRRVRLADAIPVVFERSFFPAALFPGLLDLDLTGSMYSIMRREYALGPVSAAQEITAVIADADIAALLEIPRGSPVHTPPCMSPVLFRRRAAGRTARPDEPDRPRAHLR
jgi:GntR family transcriptional regulator